MAKPPQVATMTEALFAERCPGCGAHDGLHGNGCPHKPALEWNEADPAYGIATVCAWCERAGVLHILKLQRRESDTVIVFWQGKELKISRQGMFLKVSHGICATHQAQLEAAKES